MDVQQQFLSQFKSSQSVDSTSSVHRERLLFLMLNLVGQVVEVVATNGKIFEGLFHAADIHDQPPPPPPPSSSSSSVEGNNHNHHRDEGGYSVVMKQVRIKNSKNPSKPIRPFDAFVIHGKDIAQIYAVDILFANEKQQYRDESFVTDTEISRRDFVERKLVPWMATTDGGNDHMGGGLEEAEEEGLYESLDSSKPSRRGWNQFKLNEQKFGVKSTYQEGIYTTHLDKNSQFYRENEREAARLAREIERQDTSNIHMREERGQTIAGISEEELYSSVTRMSEGKYVPPSHRKLIEMRQLQRPKQRQVEGQKAKRPSPLEGKAKTSTAAALPRTSYAAAAAPSYAPALEEDTVSKTTLPDNMPSSAAGLLTKEKLLQKKLHNRMKNLDNISTIPRRNSYAPSLSRSPLSPTRFASGRQSPLYGPAAKSPIHKIALNLDTVSPKVPIETLQEFNKFQQQVADKHIASTRQSLTDNLKSFSEEFDKVLSSHTYLKKKTITTQRLQMSRSRTDSAPVSLAPSSMSVKSAEAKQKIIAASQAPPKEEKREKHKEIADATTTSPITSEKQQQQQQQQQDKETTSKEASVSASNKQTATKKTSFKLNPKAKAFTFNPKAPAFTPGKAVHKDSAEPSQKPAAQSFVPQPAQHPQMDPSAMGGHMYLPNEMMMGGPYPPMPPYPYGPHVYMQPGMDGYAPQAGMYGGYGIPYNAQHPYPPQHPPHYPPPPPHQEYLPYEGEEEEEGLDADED